MLAVDANTVSAIAAVSAVAIALAAILVAARGLQHSRDSATASKRSADAAETSADAARLSAEAAQRTAVADEAIAAIEAERHAQETASRDAANRDAESAPKRADLSFWTEHRIATNRTFGSVDGGNEYYLVVWNSGQHKASSLGIQIAGCNGSGNQDWPANADPAALCPRDSLLPDRGFQIRLHSSGERNSWDIAECVVHWEDGLGTHDQRFRVARRW